MSQTSIKLTSNRSIAKSLEKKITKRYSDINIMMI